MKHLQKRKTICIVIVIVTILCFCLVLAACKKNSAAVEVKDSVILNDLDEMFAQYRAPSSVVQYDGSSDDVSTFTVTMSAAGNTGLRVETLFKNTTLSYKIYLDEEHTQEATALTYEVCQNDYYALVSAKGGKAKEYKIRLLTNQHDLVEVEQSPATCTEAEILIPHRHCRVCGKNFDDQYVEINDVQGEAAKGHVYVKMNESCKYGVYYECSACSAVFEKGEDGAYTPIDDLPLSSDPTKHDYVVLDDPTHAATCTEAGLGIVRCRFCGDERGKVPVLAKGHDFRVIEAERATCTQEGFKKLTCTACGYSKDEKIPARGHATENGFVAASAATCTEGGVVAHYDCARCNKHFADQAATKELSSVQSLPLGHDCAGHYDAGKAATCLESGRVAHYTCERCEKTFRDGEATTEITNVTVTRTGHDFIAHKSGVAPSCVTSGYVEYWRCKNCSSADTGFFTSIEDRFSNAYRKESLSELGLAPLGHSLDDDCRCTRCREVCHGTRFGDFCRHEEGGETYIYYGTYPQSRVTDAELCDVLTDRVGALPSAQNDRGWETYPYYVEGQRAEIGYYLDLEYKTVTYRAVYFTALRPDFTRGNVEDIFYNQSANGYQADTLYFFSFDPVKWRVLSQDGSKAMLFCTCLLDSREYFDDVATREGAAGTLYANDYAESGLRAWLNGEFYQTAFKGVSNRILVTTVKNGATDANPNGNAAAFNEGVNAYLSANTEDKIFLLSEREVTDAAYGFDADTSAEDGARMLYGSDYAKAQGLWVDQAQGKSGGSCWWLRSPDALNAEKAMRVDSEGNADGSYREVTFSAYGVAPALWVDLCPEGHDFGVGWIDDVVATCSANGLRHRTCIRCAVTEEERTVQAHSYRDGVCTLCGAPSTEKLSAEGFFVGAAQNTLYFGTYPQIEVLDGELIASLNLSAGALPTKGDPRGWTLYGYAQKGQAADPMWYIDLEMGGETYRGVYFSAYRASDPARSVDSYATQRDNGYYVGTIYWFRFEPVKWRVLQKDGGTWLLLADLLLDAQPFDDDANGYAQSTVRTFLNDSFYETAFDATQKQYILVTTVKNDLASTNPASGTFGSSNPYVSADTEDRVFLLSEREATSYSLGAYSDESTARRRVVTDYAAAQGAYRNDGSEYPQYRGLGWYWLRSPRSAAENESRYVLNSGRSDAAATVTRTDIGVLPALWFDPCAVGHDYGEAWTIKKVATCATEGEKYQTCKRCGFEKTAVISKTQDHIVVVDARIDPDCEHEGRTEGQHCSRCNKIIVAPASISPLGHVEVTNKGYAATCMSLGKTDGKYCSRCNKTLVAQQSIAMLPHNYENGICTTCVYSVSGSSSNGTVYWSKNGDSYVSQLTEVAYQSKIYYQIVPNSGYIAPTANGSTILNGNNFAFSGTRQAAKTFSSCTPRSFVISFQSNTSVLPVSFSLSHTSGNINYNGQSILNVASENNGFYDIEGWYTASSGGEKIASANGVLCANTAYTNANGRWTHLGNVTLYAQWKNSRSEIYLANTAKSGTVSGTSYTYSRTLNQMGTSGNYLLIEDLNLSGSWTPISSFSGTLNGNGYSISGMTISRSGYSGSTNLYLGLIAVLTGTVKNLNVRDSSIYVASNHEGDGWLFAGTIAGYANGNSNIESVNVYTSKVEVHRNKSEIGGVCGDSNGMIKSCKAYGITVYGNGSEGGIVGGATSTCTVSNCDISKYNETYTTIKHYGVKGATSGCNNREVGGIIGFSNGASIIECNVYYTAFIQANGSLGDPSMGYIVGTQKGGKIYHVGKGDGCTTSRQGGGSKYFFAVGWGYAGALEDNPSIS